MENKRNRKGFTLAELLIVVAIIAVLVAIAIPVFTAQLEKSREATDAANIRSAYAEVITMYLTEADDTVSIDVQSQQKQADWQGDTPKLTYQGGGSQQEVDMPACTAADQTYTVAITVDSSGVVTPNITVQ
jgi:type IV pilus assembly protein PilA